MPAPTGLGPEAGAAVAGPDFASLIVRVAAEKDRKAFAQIFAHFAPRLKTYMLRLGATPQAAEELSQETLLTLWRKAALFNPAGASASGWIYTIARNLRRDRLRRENHPAETMPELGMLSDAVPQPDDAVDTIDLEARVRRAVAQLSEEQKLVVQMSFFEDKPHGEIAAALNIPLGTVKSRIRLAMKHLRSHLGEATDL
jgi:RNA polymerase sigma-70 factor (ECF subfamily)